MNTLITCHVNADFDAFASLIGASILYPDALLVFPGTQENNLQRFINEIAKQHYHILSPKDIKDEDFSRIIIVDTRQISRLTHINQFLDNKDIEFIVWDHHPATDEDVNSNILYVENVGATATLITEEILRQGKDITSQDATVLSLGIHVDTGSFTYSSTTERDFQAASNLWKYGIDIHQVRQYLHTDLTQMHVKALNDLLETAEIHEIVDLQIVIASTTSDNYIHDFALLAPRFMEIQPCKAFFALAMMGEKIQVLARSTEKSLNVGILCSALGGGGHEYAASATVKDSNVNDLKDRLIKEVYLQLNKHKVANKLMSSPVVAVYENTSMGEANTIMTRYGLKAAPVLVKETRQCVGWISQEQAARGSALNQSTTNTPVSLFMHRDFKVVSLMASLQDLMDRIIGEKQRLLPVVHTSDNTLEQSDLREYPVIGVVTRTDLIRLFTDENTNLPMPTKAKNKKTRNLSNLLYDKLGDECVEILKYAGELAEKLSYNVSVVGGFVRDLVMDQKTRHWSELDIDLVVEGDGIHFSKELSKHLKGKVRIHFAFMTSTIIFTNKSGVECKLDIATARLEYYEFPAALPTVEVSSLKMDLYRRDFTINSMAIRLNPKAYGALVDFFGGQIDIRNKKIRMLHTLSFIEDPTRILRAIRFEQRYNFSIVVQCEKLMQNALSIQMIDKLSGARIVGELELIIKEESLYKYFSRMEEFNLLHAIHPYLKLEPGKENILRAVLSSIEWFKKLYLSEKVDFLSIIILALLRNAQIDDFEDVAQRLNFTPQRIAKLLQIRSHVIATFHDLERWVKQEERVSVLCRLLEKCPLEAVLYCMARTNEEELKKALTQYIYKWRTEKADINGKDLEKLGIPKGRIYKELLLIALDAKLDNEESTHEDQLKLVENIYKDYEDVLSK